MDHSVFRIFSERNNAYYCFGGWTETHPWIEHASIQYPFSGHARLPAINFPSVTWGDGRPNVPLHCAENTFMKFSAIVTVTVDVKIHLTVDVKIYLTVDAVRVALRWKRVVVFPFLITRNQYISRQWFS